VDEFIGVAADFVVKIVKRKAEPSAAVQLDEGVTVEYPFEVKTYGFDVVNVGIVDKLQALVLSGKGRGARQQEKDKQQGDGAQVQREVVKAKIHPEYFLLKGKRCFWAKVVLYYGFDVLLRPLVRTSQGKGLS
jgi:hypothetical protein